MANFLTPVKTVKKVQNNIEKFESLSLKENRPPSKDNQPLKIISSTKVEKVLEADESTSQRLEKNAFEPISISRAKSLVRTGDIEIKQHKQHDSTVFLKQSYLGENASPALSDNAREILRCQPTHEDLVAVLQYLQFGIEGRHDFNILVANPKTAQVLNVLVSVTIPDVWANIGGKDLSIDEAKMKKTILSSLSSVAGLGALLTQMKQLTTSHSSVPVLCDIIAVLGHILKGHNTLLSFLRYPQKLYERESERRMLWQEVIALFAGSRILSTVAQTFAIQSVLKENLQPYLWIGDGVHYVRWLGSNIAQAAIKLTPNNEELWKVLSQVVKRGLSLGHRGMFDESIS